MAKPWREIGEAGRFLVREVLATTRANALRSAALVLSADHVKTCTVHTQEEHALMALKMAERAEDAFDAALEHLGFAS